MAVIPKDPMEWLTFFRQRINEIFTFLATLEGKEGTAEHAYAPLVDIFETRDRFVVEVDLPGFEGGDLALTICCNVLVIEGVKREEARSGVTYICLERHFGRFCRTVEIPPMVDLNGAAARYGEGVLSVTFPRLQDKSTFIREIPIEQGD